MYLRIGKQLFGSKNFEDALKKFNQAILRDPSNAEHFVERRKCFVNMNLLEKALEDSKEIVRLRKEFEDYCCLVRDLLGLKELDAAKEALSTAVHIFTETSTLKVLAKDLAAAEEVRARSQQSWKEYASREQATKEIELLSQVAKHLKVT